MSNSITLLHTSINRGYSSLKKAPISLETKLKLAQLMVRYGLEGNMIMDVSESDSTLRDGQGTLREIIQLTGAPEAFRTFISPNRHVGMATIVSAAAFDYIDQPQQVKICGPKKTPKGGSGGHQQDRVITLLKPKNTQLLEAFGDKFAHVAQHQISYADINFLDPLNIRTRSIQGRDGFTIARKLISEGYFTVVARDVNAFMPIDRRFELEARKKFGFVSPTDELGASYKFERTEGYTGRLNRAWQIARLTIPSLIERLGLNAQPDSICVPEEVYFSGRFCFKPFLEEVEEFDHGVLGLEVIPYSE